MNYTTNFNLNKPEGTDLYNHLTVDNPNMDTIDATMQANKLASVGAATELVSGTVHAITRADSNQNIFKFKATGDFKAGDTITVDGVSVNAYTTGGQPLVNDAYIISAEVLCILDNTSLWVLTNRTPDDMDASNVNYDNTASGLTANNAQTAFDELANADNLIRARLTAVEPIILTTDITSDAQMGALPINSTRMAYVYYTGAPYSNRWCTIFTIGSLIVRNQFLVCESGIACRHYENSTWYVWKKVNFS